jgi:hypothetical protein
LHIVSLDVPFPPDYGGVMDIYYRIECLCNLGFQLTIHAFEYGRGKQKHLEKFGNVIYYSRNFSKLQLFSRIPFIVLSRNSSLLLKNLLLDSNPILFEGIHTTFFLSHPDLQKRLKFVRTHNVEYKYYQQLATNTGSLVKKLFFLLESKKLKTYERQTKHANWILSIKPEDTEYFKHFNPKALTLPASISKELNEYSQTKNYALFHGNLSVMENENAVFWIHNAIKKSISCDFEFIIAGKDPSKKLVNFCTENNLQLIENPSIEKMNELICDARIHVFQSKSDSGVKLKLLKSLNSCGHIITTQNLIFDSQINNLCHIVNSKNDFNTLFEILKSKFLDRNEFEMRMEFLRNYFQMEERVLGDLLNNQYNAS